MTATCSTKGGYPKPELKWSSGDGGTGLEPRELETNITVPLAAQSTSQGFRR